MCQSELQIKGVAALFYWKLSWSSIKNNCPCSGFNFTKQTNVKKAEPPGSLASSSATLFGHLLLSSKHKKLTWLYRLLPSDSPSLRNQALHLSHCCLGSLTHSSLLHRSTLWSLDRSPPDCCAGSYLTPGWYCLSPGWIHQTPGWSPVSKTGALSYPQVWPKRTLHTCVFTQSAGFQQNPIMGLKVPSRLSYYGVFKLQAPTSDYRTLRKLKHKLSPFTNTWELLKLQLWKSCVVFYCVSLWQGLALSHKVFLSKMSKQSADSEI